MNWGMKVVLGMTVFMIFIISAGIYMVVHDSDSLIEEDYYEKGLAYDDTYAKKQNLLYDAAEPQMKIDKDTLYILFKRERNKGDLFFKRPSDGKLDLKVPFYTNATVFKVPLVTFSKGNWILELNWEQGGRSYFYAQSVFLN